MSRPGLEQSRISYGKRNILPGALQNVLHGAGDPQLRAVIDAWPGLNKTTRRKIMLLANRNED